MAAGRGKTTTHYKGPGERGFHTILLLGVVIGEERKEEEVLLQEGGIVRRPGFVFPGKVLILKKHVIVSPQKKRARISGKRSGLNGKAANITLRGGRGDTRL